MVKGGASLPWGRMLASGTWGVSLLFLEPAIDSSGIVGTSRFSFPADCVMRRFVNLANEATLRLLEEVFPKLTRGMFAAQPNPPADIRVPPGTDACEVKRLFTDAHARGQRIYLPPRAPAEAVVNPRWPAEFVHAFKLANDAPYPRWQDASSRCHEQ